MKKKGPRIHSPLFLEQEREEDLAHRKFAKGKDQGRESGSKGEKDEESENGRKILFALVPEENFKPRSVCLVLVLSPSWPGLESIYLIFLDAD